MIKNQKKWNCLFLFIICMLFIGNNDYVDAKAGIVNCGNILIQNNVTNSSEYLYIATFTRQKGTATGLYPIYVQKDSNNNITEANFAISGDSAYFGSKNVTWPEQISDMCPESCTYENGIIKDSYDCVGIKEPEEKWNFSNQFQVYVFFTKGPLLSATEMYESSINAESGIFYYAKNESPSKIIVSRLQENIVNYLKGLSNASTKSGTDNCQDDAKNKKSWYGGIGNNGEFDGLGTYLSWGRHWGVCPDNIDVIFKTGDITEDVVKAKTDTIKTSDFLKNEYSDLKKDTTSAYSTCKSINNTPEVILPSSDIKNLLDNQLSIKNIKKMQDIYNYSSGRKNSLDIIADEIIYEKADSMQLGGFTGLSNHTISVIKNIIKEKSGGKSIALTNPDIEKQVIAYKDVFLKCMENVSNNVKYYNLTNEQKEKLSAIYDGLGEIAFQEKTVTSCEDLFGNKLRKKLTEYMNTITIIVVILVIFLSIVDFVSSLLQSSEDDMKKSQAKLIKRLIIAAIIFLTPTLVNFILTIANKIWGFIDPNSCIKF